MLLTKDNILRFVQQHKYTTPTTVAREFDTTTTIASAALGELVDGINIETTHIKFGTTPYYYDPKQKEFLEEIAQKSFSDNELELFNKIKKEQIVSLNTLTIPQRSILSKLKDIYYEIQITKDQKEYTFIIWHMRSEQETRTQIQDALFPSTKNNSNNEKNPKKNSLDDNSSTTSKNKEVESNTREQTTNSKEETTSNPFSNLYKQHSTKNDNSDSTQLNNKNNLSDYEENNLSLNSTSKSKSRDEKVVKSTQTQNSCDNYLFEQGYTIIEKEKHSLGNIYKVSIPMNEFTLVIDCLSIEQKKVQIKQILEFYTSSIRPKIIFHTTLPKKIQSTIEELENCFIIEIKN